VQGGVARSQSLVLDLVDSRHTPARCDDGSIMTRAWLGFAVAALFFAACAPRDASEVEAPPKAQRATRSTTSAKPTAQAGLWLEVEGRVKKVATVAKDGEIVMSVPELRYSAPSIRRLGARLEARELIIEGEPDISLRIDEEGYIRTVPETFVENGTLRVVGSELIAGERRFRLDDAGAVSPPILEAANLWLRGADELSAEQKWLLVVAELSFVRGGEVMFFVL
jgi:hypothetical protein